MIFSGMTSSNTAEYKFYLKSGVIKFQFNIIKYMIKAEKLFTKYIPLIVAGYIEFKLIYLRRKL